MEVRAQRAAGRGACAHTVAVRRQPQRIGRAVSASASRKERKLEAQQRAREKEEAREARNATAVAQSSVAEEEDDDVVDPVITDRMLSRVFTFAGLPVLFGLALYPLFWYLKVVKDVDLPMGLVFVVQSITFGAGLLGITYGVTSASWDPARKGSALGWTEFRANLGAIMGKVGPGK